MAGRSSTAPKIVRALAALAGVAALPALAWLPALVAPEAARASLIRIGSQPALPPGAIVAGNLSPGTVLHITVALEPRDPAALAAYARAVSSLNSSAYHQYLDPAQFARRFGASAAEVQTVAGALRARGLRPGPVSAGSLSIPVTATAAQLERGLSISLRKLALPGGRTAVASLAAPALGSAAASAVQAIIGLDTAAAPRPLLVRPAAHTRPAFAQAHVATGGPQPCPAAQSTASIDGAHTADQLASAYGFSGLYSGGNLGAGSTIAVYELEPNSPSDIAAYQSCYGTHTSIGYVPVDGGVGSGAGSGEAALDIEDLLGLAPAAKLLVYQGPNSNSSAPGSGPYDTFSAIVNQDRAQVVSVSYGECESALGAAGATAENTLFQQAAVEGQTIVAASGDSGSADCDAGGLIPQTQLAVDDPSSQPFVLGVGGTTLGALGPRPSESVWNSGGGLAAQLMQSGAGGGGVSALWPMPAGQLQSAPALNVLGAGATGSQCGNAGGYCREVPDVSAAADPSSGYVIYYNGSGSAAGQPQGWQAIGGTSAASPLWAALIGLADASRGCAGGPIGNAVAAVYRAAGSAYAADFNDVRAGNNDFTGTNGGRFAAGSGYDEASGLGTPNASALAGSLCADSLRLIDPGARRSAAGATVALRLGVQDIRGATPSFHATGLPPGLKLNPASGRVSGEPRRVGTYEVSVVAHDASGQAASKTFSWSIGAPTRARGVALSGVSIRRPALSFTVVAGRGSPTLTGLEVGLPSRLRFTSARGVQLSSGATRPRFSASVRRGVLRITLRRAQSSVHVSISYPALAGAPGRGGLTITVFDAGHGSTPLRARLGSGGR